MPWLPMSHFNFGGDEGSPIYLRLNVCHTDRMETQVMTIAITFYLFAHWICNLRLIFLALNNIIKLHKHVQS